MLKEFVLKELSLLLKQLSFLLKESVVLKELSLLLEARDIFLIFPTANVENKVLINLDSVKLNHLKLGRSGVDEALRHR